MLDRFRNALHNRAGIKDIRGRGLMIGVQGEDYVKLAEAKGLRPRYILYRYMIRNAILPQITAFALKVGLLVAGQVLVERIFAYNGMGKLLYDAILNQDFPVIQGVSYVIILMTAISDQLAPLTDMRELRDRLSGPSELFTFTSLYGHDAFLKEYDAMSPRLEEFCKGLV